MKQINFDKLIDKAFLESIQNQENFTWTSLKLPFEENLEVKILEKKTFQKLDPEGWIWFKNLNIPTINIQMLSEFKDRVIKARLFSIRYFQELNKVDEVELKGENSIYIKNRDSQIAGLKFIATSYLHKGQKFYLVLCFYEETTQNNIVSEKMIGPILISQPVFVESRKKAVQEKKTTISYFDPFLPETYEKQYVKVKNCKPNIVAIEEDLEGLYNYFTTPTIRHKSQKFFVLAQQQVYNNLFKYENDNENVQIPIFQRLFIVCLRSPESQQENSKVDKITKFLQNLDTSAAAYFSFQNELIDHDIFEELVYKEQLKDIYKKSYSQLSFMKFEMRNPELQQVKNDVDNNSQQAYVVSSKQYQQNIMVNNWDDMHSVFTHFHCAIFDLTVQNKEERCRRIPIKVVNPNFKNDQSISLKERKAEKNNCFITTEDTAISQSSDSNNIKIKQSQEEKTYKRKSQSNDQVEIFEENIKKSKINQTLNNTGTPTMPQITSSSGELDNQQTSLTEAELDTALIYQRQLQTTQKKVKIEEQPLNMLKENEKNSNNQQQVQWQEQKLPEYNQNYVVQPLFSKKEQLPNYQQPQRQQEWVNYFNYPQQQQQYELNYQQQLSNTQNNSSNSANIMLQNSFPNQQPNFLMRPDIQFNQQQQPQVYPPQYSNSNIILQYVPQTIMYPNQLQNQQQQYYQPTQFVNNYEFYPNQYNTM